LLFESAQLAGEHVPFKSVIGPRDWGPRDNFQETAKHLPKKSTRCSWGKKFCVK